MKRRNKGFTLIELVAVLVILAILALIVTPLVMNIVKKAKDSANKRSVDAYGKAVELAVATYLLDNGDYPTDLNGLTVEYSGNEVACNVKTLNEDGSIYLSECSVKGVEVKDFKNKDGWYHYGSTTNAYRTYKVGDMLEYKGMDFYVVSPSDENTDYVTLLKEKPLTTEEVNVYGLGHVNRYTSESVGTALDVNGYGYMAYYTSENCGVVNGSDWVYDGCTTDYAQSEIKYVVDGWANTKLDVQDLKEDELGYKTRLLTYDELVANLGYERQNGGTIFPSTNGETPSWVYEYAGYWTMSPSSDNGRGVFTVMNSGGIYPYNSIYSTHYNSDVEAFSVRPVINLKKSAIDTKEYKTYKDGEEVYYNPETNQICNEDEAVSTTGTKTGCMKWYAFNDNGTYKLNLILDHNVVSSVSGTENIKNSLTNSTSSWNNNITIRFIKAEEIAKIVGNSNFDVSVAGSEDWFYLEDNSQNVPQLSQGEAKYKWLFDNLYGCTDYGCDTNQGYSWGNGGYWTLSPVANASYSVWIIANKGSLESKGVGYAPSESIGIRPVVTISKSVLET